MNFTVHERHYFFFVLEMQTTGMVETNAFRVLVGHPFGKRSL